MVDIIVIDVTTVPGVADRRAANDHNLLIKLKLAGFMKNRFSILFLGGVHGVGKSTLCQRLIEVRPDVQYFTASALIKEANAAAISTVGKRVANVEENQEVLVSAFTDKINALRARFIIIDGHFALRDATGSIKCLSPSLFASLEIEVFVLVVDTASAIADRLLARDGSADSAESIGELQDAELKNARHVSSILSRPLFEVKFGDLESLMKVLTVAAASSTHTD